MAIQILAVLTRGLMCGSELNVAVFSHPTLQRHPLDVHTIVRSSFARLFGSVMPFWMTASTLLNLLLLMPFWHLTRSAWRFDAMALALQLFSVLFSLAAAVPINSRIARWTPTTLPRDWQVQEHRWDIYNWFRTGGLIVAFALRCLGLSV